MSSNAELIKIAQGVYENICAMLDSEDYHYAKDDDRMRINLTMQGEGIPIDIYFNVDSERQFVQVLSPLPFTIPENKCVDLAVAISVANDHFANGSFDFNFSRGKIVFRLTSSYIDSILGRELFYYMLRITITTVDRYSDKFMMLGKGLMTLDQFMEADANR